MSRIQRLLMKIVPQRWAQSMEAESRQWMLQCPNCNHEQSVWEAGGVRWKAKGNPKKLMRCPNCGEQTWHTTYRKQ